MVIELAELTKFYGTLKALDSVSLRLEAGAIGLLGPNGAGKSTLIKCLLGLVAVTMGKGSVLGLDIRRSSRDIRQRIGFMPEDDCYLAGLTAVESVTFGGELAGMARGEAMRRSHEILDYVGISEERYREVQTFSTGMKQKVKLAQALIHDPELVFLDEPTNGLDPEGRDRMLKLIRNLADKRNISVVLSSHLLHDIETVCSQVVIMGRGKVLKSDTLANLQRPANESYTVHLHEESPQLVAALEQAGCQVLTVNSLTLRVSGHADISALAFSLADRTQAQIRQLFPARNSLEEVFMDAISEEPPRANL